MIIGYLHISWSHVWNSENMTGFLMCKCVYKNLTKTWLTPWSTVLLDKLLVTQLVTKFPAFMEPKGSLPCSQQPATGPYPEPDAFSPHVPTLFSLWSTLSSRLRLGFPSGLLPGDFPTKISYALLISPVRATCPAHPILLENILAVYHFIWRLKFSYVCPPRWINTKEKRFRYDIRKQILHVIYITLYYKPFLRNKNSTWDFIFPRWFILNAVFWASQRVEMAKITDVSGELYCFLL
jgi:hypothetical protein